MNAPFKLVAGLIFSLFGIIIFFMTYFTVDPNEVAVVTSFGKIDYVADPGLHFKTPFVNGVKFFRTDIQEIQPPSSAVNTYTIDNQEVDVVFNVFFRIPPKQVEFIYKNVPDYRDRLYSMTVDRLKSAMGKVNVSSVAEKRGELRDSIKATLAESATSLGIEITDVQLTDMQYAATYRDAIAQAASQKAGVEAKEYVRQQAQKEAETVAIKAEGQANAAKAEAIGNAAATVANAEADARAIVLKGEAEGQAINAKAKALAANPQIVDYTKALQWDGALPVNMFAGAPVPFFNVGAGK